MSKIIRIIQNCYQKRKSWLCSLVILMLLIDLVLGITESYTVRKGSTGNKLVFLYLHTMYEDYFLQHIDKGKFTRKYIAKWDNVFKGKKRIIPYLWEDRDYIIPAPASINYIRKLFYKRQAAYLLFDMNNASEKIQNDPNTIIISTPYSCNGGRKVYTVGSFKNLSGDVKYWMPEDEYQKQLKKQHWNPVPKSPPPGFKVPDDIAYELHIVRE